MLHLYIDTSVFGALTDPGEERPQATRRLLEGLARGDHRPHISTVVLAEIRRAGPEPRSCMEAAVARVAAVVLLPDEEARALAAEYLEEGILLPKSGNDALHVAIASVHGLDAVVSWNFRHLVNIEKKRRFQAVNLRLGYKLLDIVAPWEVP